MVAFWPGFGCRRMTRMSYEVRTGLYQGPLDLLLHLILRDEVDLYALSLAELVDAYLTEMDRILAEAD